MTNEAGKVRRFSMNPGIGSLADDNGWFCTYADYEASERRVKWLEAQNAALVELVKAVCWCDGEVCLEPVRDKYWMQARDAALSTQAGETKV